MFICFISISLLNFFRGEETVSILGIIKCSNTYWILTAATLLISAGFWVIVYLIFKREEKNKIKQEQNLENYKKRYTNKIFVFLFTTGLISGFLTGALSAGSGLLTVPLLLKFGLHPTSSFNNLWIVLTLIYNLLLSEELGTSEIVIFTLLAAFGGLVITEIIYILVKKYKKNYFIIIFVFVLAVLNVVGNVISIF